MLIFLVVLVGGYVLINVALYTFQRRLIYFPDTAVANLAASGLEDVQEVTLRTSDGLDLLAWAGKPQAGMPSVVYFHGNAGHIGGRIDKIRPFLAAGYGVLLVEYRGFGGNKGRPTETGLYADGRAAVDFLNTQGIGVKDIVLYGESLGTAVAVRMATEFADRGDEILALVLEAPFTSVVEVAANRFALFPIRRLLHDRFDSAAIINRVGTATMIFHGEKDTTMPIRYGRKLFDLAADPKESLWLAGAGHNDLFDHGGARAVLDFMARERAKQGK